MADVTNSPFSTVRFGYKESRNTGIVRVFQPKTSGVSLQCRLRGGEGGIRTLPCPMASVSYRNYIAKNAKFTTFAVHHCTLLHAGKIRY
jgi:hypothetical protein